MTNGSFIRLKTKNVTLAKNKQLLFSNGGWAVFSGILCFALNLFLAHQIIGILGIILWLVGTTLRFKTISLFGNEFFSRILFGFLSIGSAFVFLLVAWYSIFNLSASSTFIIFSIVLIGLLLLPIKEPKQLTLNFKKTTSLYWLGLVAFADILIISLFIFKRTDSALVSPWGLFEAQPFALFAIATFIFLFTATKRKDDLSVLIGILHTFTAVSVSAIVFAIGFGFDPFIHRAAEEALALTGSIQPRQLLYTGQYLLITAIHHLTALPLKQIDIWAIPLLTSLVLPVGGYIGLKNGWGLSKEQAHTWWITALTSSFMVITYTIPFSFTFLFFLLTLFLLPSIKTNSQKTIFLFASIVSILFHPLLAVPNTLFIIAYFLQKQIKTLSVKIISWVISTLAIAASVPAMLIIYQNSQNQSVAFDNIISRLQNFYNLFKNPFGYTSPQTPWHLAAIYELQFLLPFILLLAAVISAIIFFKKQKTIATEYLIYLLGLIIAIFATSTLFYFKDIINYEQSEFAYRLLNAWYLIALPFVAILLSKLSLKKGLAFPVIFLTTFLILHAWFFSYPQYNQKNQNISPSVSQTDIDIVKKIEEQSGGEPYIVLSNQMTSAAALQTFGFYKYITLDQEKVLWYAIPTGGELYKYYLETIFQNPTRERFDKLLAQSDANKIYFVLNNYWNWTEPFLNQMEEMADNIIDLGNNQTKIIEFSK